MTKKGSDTFTHFDGTNTPKDFDFPSIEIEDIDRAVFQLFDKKIRFEVEQNGKSKKIPVVFSSGERFALTRRKDPIRDRNDAIILPIIAIQRGTIDTSHNQHGKGTAIAYGDQPGYYIKRRLAESDRNYQNIVNKQGLKNQDNVSAKKNFGSSLIYPGNTNLPNTVASRRNKANGFISQNIDLSDNLGNNIFEIIEIPYPKFVAIQYDITFWCQYMTQMNQVIQNIFINYRGQGHEIPIETEAGFEMVAFFSDNIVLDTNISNYASEERIIKYKTQITVNGYMLNPKTIKGVPNNLRSFFSAPKIDFGYKEIDKKSNVIFNNEKKDNNKFTLSDIKNVDELKGTVRGESSEIIEYYVDNPFTGKKQRKLSKVISSNKRTGESVISPLTIHEIDRQYD
jgi:hypothetical protein